MLRHNILIHLEEDPFNEEYIWEPLKFFQKPMYRQVTEALAIKEAYGNQKTLVMNGKNRI